MSFFYETTAALFQSITDLIDEAWYSDEEKARDYIRIRIKEIEAEIQKRFLEEENIIEAITNNLLSQIEFLINFHRKSEVKEPSYNSLITLAERLGKWLDEEKEE